MIGRVLSIKKNPKGIYGFIKTDEGNYYYDTSSLQKGVFLKVGVQVQFDIIPWQGNRTKAVNVRFVEYLVLEEDVKEAVREMITISMGQNVYLDVARVSELLSERGINYRDYAGTMLEFFAKYYKKDFIIEKNYKVDDKTYPAVLILGNNAGKILLDEQVAIIRENFLDEVSASGFVQAVKVPNILRSVGIATYRNYAASIDEFIEKYIPNTFVSKKAVFINGKRYPKIYVLIEESDNYIEGEEATREDIVDEDVVFDELLKTTVENGLRQIIMSDNFVLGSEMPNVLRSLGVADYKLFANSIEEFISKYYEDIFEMKKNVVINEKNYSSIITLRNDNRYDEILVKNEPDIHEIIESMMLMLNEGKFEAVLKQEAVLKYGPQDFGSRGIEVLLKAIGGFLGDDIEHINLNQYHRVLIETETVADLKQYKDSDEVLSLGADSAMVPMQLSEYKRIFTDICNGKKNINIYWNAIVERFWSAQSEMALYVSCLWLIITKHEKSIDIYIEEASKHSRIDQLICLLKINQTFGRFNITERLQRKIIGRCLDFNDTNTLITAIDYFGNTMIPECLSFQDFFRERISVDEKQLMLWFHSGIGEQISEKITNYYWWKYSINGIDQTLFKVLASVYWEYPENYYTEIIYNPSCPQFGRQEKEKLLKENFVLLCEQTKSYKKAFPWINYLYVSLFEDVRDEEIRNSWQELQSKMKNEIEEHFSGDLNSARSIALFRLNAEIRTELEERYCEEYVADILEELSDSEELDKFVEECEKLGLQFITQWIIKHSDVNNNSNEEAYIMSLCNSRDFDEAITFVQKSNISASQKLSLLRMVLCENFKAYNVSDDAFSVFENSIPVVIAEAALKSDLVHTNHDAVSALIALYYYKKEWLKVAYLLAPLNALYIDAHRKLIEDTRVLAQEKYNVNLVDLGTNHYEVVKVALKVLDTEEFDDFIEWARNILTMPIGAKKYNFTTKIFDREIQAFITDGSKDSCWQQLVKTALVTDHNDNQDNLRFSIIASYIGRYGIESIENIITSLAKKANSTKGYVDYYIGLWKGLLIGKYSVNFLRLCKNLIGKEPITFWNLFYDIVVCKNHIFSTDDFALKQLRSDSQDYQGFYSECLDSYNDTREIVYIKIAVALLKNCEEDIDPEFEKYISFLRGARNKDFLISALACLLEQERYEIKIKEFIASDHWNGSAKMHDILKLLRWCCSDDLHDESLTNAEVAMLKRDCLCCIKRYPVIDVNYAQNVSEKYRRRLLKEIVKIHYSTTLRDEPKNVPDITAEWRTDYALRDYLELITVLYQQQLVGKTSNDVTYIVNRYVRILVGQVLLAKSIEEFSDEQIVSLMSQNKHFNAVYSDYNIVKELIFRIWSLKGETELHKVIFLTGMLSNKWDQFISGAKEYSEDALEIINAIEERTNYRDFNIQILNCYIKQKYHISDIYYLKLCSPKVYRILQELKSIGEISKEETSIAEELLEGICRLENPDIAKESYTYLKDALQAYPTELRKHWNMYMEAVEATSYFNTITYHLLFEIRKRTVSVENVKKWMPVFSFFENLSVYYFFLAVRYALNRKKKEAREAFSYISDKSVLPREWGEDIKDLENYLLGRTHYFVMKNNVLQVADIEKDVETISFVENAAKKVEITAFEAIDACETILSGETENRVKLDSYKKLFNYIKTPDDLFELYRQVESTTRNQKRERYSYNELLIEFGCLLVCYEDSLSMDEKMQILLEVFDVFSFLNDLNKGKLSTLEKLALAEQCVLERTGVSFENWINNKDKIIAILKHPAINCPEDIIQKFCKLLEKCKGISDSCTSEMQKLDELSMWRNKWNMQQSCSDYEYAFVRSVEEKIKSLKSGVNLSVSIVNNTIEDFGVYFCVENKAESSNATVSLNNTCQNDSASLEVLVAVNGDTFVSYEGAEFNSIVELRPGDVCGQYYRLHNSIITNIDNGDLLTIIIRIIVDNKVICDCKGTYVYKTANNKSGLNERLVSNVAKYETNVPAFSKTIRGYGREVEKQLIRQYLDQQLVVIYGPSRVGKSSLVNYISNEYILEYSKEERKTVVAIAIADDRHGNDYNDNMIDENEKVSFENTSDLLRYLFINPLKIAFGSTEGLKLKSRMRCGIAGEKPLEAMRNEIEGIISAEVSVRDILAVVSQILEENNCQVWYLFDEFQQIVERWTGDTTEFTDICNDIMNYQSSIKLVLCGSDDLVRLYNCVNDINWRGFIQKTADNGVPIGQLSPNDFEAMMKDISIWGDVSENDPWSPEALKLLYQYTGGNAICGKLFGNELLNKIRNGEFDSREKLYPSDITQVAYELLNSEVGLVRNLLVLHNTKNLEDEMPYILFIAYELVQDKNKSDVSIRRIREFFSVKTPEEIENSLKVLIARGILKINSDRKRYGFSTMFYFDFFRSQATELRMQELSEELEAQKQNEGLPKNTRVQLTEPKEISQLILDLWNDFAKIDESNPEKAAERDKIKRQIGTVINAKQVNTEGGEGRLTEGDDITYNNYINIQNMTTALTNIITGQNVLEAYHQLPTLSSYISAQLPEQSRRLLEGKYQELQNVNLSDEQRLVIQDEIYELSSPAVDALASDYVTASMNYIMSGDLSEEADDIADEGQDSIVDEYDRIGLSKETVDEIRTSLPSNIQIQFDFAVMLHKIFYQLKDEQNIDYCPVAILYCKMIEGLLKEKHFEIYIQKLSVGDFPKVRIGARDYDWNYFMRNGEIDKKKVKQNRKKLTLGTFSFPLGRISNINDINSEIIVDEDVVEALATPVGSDMPNQKELRTWRKHAQLLPWIREYRNRSAHELTPISREDMDNITEILFASEEINRIISLIPRSK